MKFPPVFKINDKNKSLLNEIDILKAAYQMMPTPDDLIVRLRREKILKSSLFSARIEGNPMDIRDRRMMDAQNVKDFNQREIGNIEQALDYIARQTDIIITIDLIKKLHGIVMSGISGWAGYLRTEEAAIFNQAGIAVYLTPKPQIVSRLLDDLCSYTYKSSDPLPVQAALVHIWFEKIHPFVDGNGRVGRLISDAMLIRSGYNLGGIVPFEEYLDANRQLYYDALMPDRQDVTGFIEFFLEAITIQSKKTLEEIRNPPKIDYPELLPRRSEITIIIKEHQMVSFDFIKRRFQKVPAATLHYDIQFLLKKGYLIKRGTTRGALYMIKK